MSTKKQKEFEGPEFERKVDKLIEKLANQYVDARDARMELTDKEVDSKKALLSAMHEKGMTVYHGEDFDINVEPSEKIKVRRTKDTTTTTSDE